MTRPALPHIKLGISSRLFQGWPMEEVFQYTAALGYSGVEIVPHTLGKAVPEISSAERNRIRQAAAAAGSEVLGLHSLLVWPEGFYINHPEAEVRRRTQAYLVECINLCADLGGRTLVHGSGSQRTVQAGWDASLAWEHARETFAVCARAAETRNVTYCLEPLRRAETNFLNTMDEALQMVRAVGNPHLKMVVDSRHTLFNETTGLPRVIAEVHRQGCLAHVHVNDLTGKGPGFGETQLTPALRALCELGYAGYVSVEVFDYAPDPRTIASRSIGYLHGILEAITI
jgi:D-psicose/D-tagatose/L-ribulose 3-epimerase